MERRKFTAKFKTKVVLEALKERQSAKELAERFKVK
jgi:transposase